MDSCKLNIYYKTKQGVEGTFQGEFHGRGVDIEFLREEVYKQLYIAGEVDQPTDVVILVSIPGHKV